MSDTTYDNCTSVTPECPVSETTLSYAPNLGANAFFVAIFAICLIAQIAAGIRWKTWTWMIAISLGCVTQIIGYIGRLMLNSNPWDDNGFTMQITCLIIAPAFTTAAVYLTLKHFVLAFGTRYSPLKPNLYTWIFVSGDILSLVIQGTGGGIAASAETTSNLDLGGNIMLGGIVFQVVWLAIFAALCLAYFLRVWRHRAELSHEARSLATSTKFRLFAFAGVLLAFTTILIRCIYRVPELASGWGSALFQNEVDFIVLDGVMMSVATLALTIFHPGYFFPQLSAPFYAQQEQRSKEMASPWSSDGSQVEGRGDMVQRV